MLTQAAAGGAGAGDADAAIAETAKDILERLPAAFDLEVVAARWPVQYEESMNTVLAQEMTRFNKLTNVIRTTLVDVGKALKGFVVMSADLETVATAMFTAKVPALWAKASYPSLKPLGSYIDELLERLNMLSLWLDNGQPPVFWISGFFFTHAFLTGAMQNYARRNKFAIDEVALDFEMLKEEKESLVKGPPDGVYTFGPFFDGARWSKEKHTIVESENKVLYSPSPVMWLVPRKRTELKVFPHYKCPLYKTGDRRGILATTGHSTNFIFDVRIPSDQPAAHWVKRGVALLASLSD